MSDMLEALRALEQDSIKVCPVVRVAGQLESEAGEYVLKLSKNPLVSVRKLYATLHKAGLSVGRESLTKHRNDQCDCANG